MRDTLSPSQIVQLDSSRHVIVVASVEHSNCAFCFHFPAFPRHCRCAITMFTALSILGNEPSSCPYNTADQAFCTKAVACLGQSKSFYSFIADDC